jgi:sorting nexin-29
VEASEDEDVPIPILEGVKCSTQKPNNKAPGPDGLRVEPLKIEENKIIGRLRKVTEKTLTEEKIPRQWEQGLICPIYKGGDRLICEEYRGISLLNTAYKVFSTILFQRLQPYTEKIGGNYQCIFRNGKSTSGQLHTTGLILEKMGECGLNTFYLFVDFRAAYDSTDRTQLFKAVEEFQIPRKLTSLAEKTLRNTRCKLKTPNGITYPFDTKKGLRQVDALSCMLFNTALEKAVTEANLDIRGTILLKYLQILAYAHDVVTEGRYEIAVKDALNRLEMTALKMGIMINHDKTKYMETICKPIKEKYIRINKRDIEKVNEFK